MLVLDVEREVALERFLKRGRAGDVFERRFDEHETFIELAVEMMERDGMRTVRVGKGEDMQEVVKRLGGFLC